MPFLVACTNKGCGKTQSPYLDLASDKVYCSECGKEINNITSFAKTQMKSLNQVKKDSKKSFSVRCSSCGKENRPKEVNKQFICGNCNKPLTGLSQAFISILKAALKDADKDVV
jgi:ribosomal protein L34E